MRDITINNDESQNKKQKTTPVTEPLSEQEKFKKALSEAILQIWQGVRVALETPC